MAKGDESKEFDLIVIGAGPAGYTGAIRAAQLGMKVACVDSRQHLGGTCLNEGCIPSKALLYSSESYEHCKHSFADMGIITDAKLDLGQMMKRKNKIVDDLRGGIKALFAKNKITHLTGSAKITAANEVTVGNKKYKASNILIATGSVSSDLPGIEINGKNIISSKEALELASVPSSIIVIGGGYIGLELGSVWRRLGSKVSIVEYADSIVPAMDAEISKNLLKILQKQGIDFHLSSKVQKAVASKSAVEVIAEGVKDNQQQTLKSEIVMVAVGRKPFTDGLFSDAIALGLDERGRIMVDQNFRTSAPGIYAVGDVIAGPMLAHKAEEEAVAAAEIMAGQSPHVNYNTIPGVIYTDPEVASVGKTEQELKSDGIPYKIGKFPFMANSRARAIGKTDGMVKILASSSTDEVLGCHIIGPEAGTLIAEAAALMEFKASSEDIARICHAHPTLNEAVKEAALAVDKRSVNF